MGMTMTQKILAAHAGLSEVHAGDLIEAKLQVIEIAGVDSADQELGHDPAGMTFLCSETSGASAGNSKTGYWNLSVG